MKKKDFEKIKSESLISLKKELIDLKRKFVEVSAKIQAGKESNLKAAKLIRVKIAKIQTLIGQKKMEPVSTSKAGKETK